jgi:hypothetical protein
MGSSNRLNAEQKSYGPLSFLRIQNVAGRDRPAIIMSWTPTTVQRLLFGKELLAESVPHFVADQCQPTAKGDFYLT